MAEAPWKVAGRTAAAMAGHRFWAEGASCDAYVAPPLTIECWVRVHEREQRNSLISLHPRESNQHWALFTDLGTGHLCAQMAYYDPFELRSTVDLADGKWHHVAFQFDTALARLLLDGREVASRKISRVPGGSVAQGPLCIGLEPGRTPLFDCAADVEQVRISKGVRPLEKPQDRFTADAGTIGLWSFDRVDDGVLDQSGGKTPLRVCQKPSASLDDLDRASFAARSTPWQVPAIRAEVSDGAWPASAPAVLPIALDGAWDLAADGEVTTRVSGDWPDAVHAVVPGSVHTALRDAGIIPEPSFGRYDSAARVQSFKTWWMRRQFKVAKEALGGRFLLSFGGVAVSCAVWLNGRRLGEHSGMFGGPEFEVGDLLAENNTLIVRIDPAPYEVGKGFPNQFFLGMNVGWMRNVVFNNVYGWHYSDIPSLGIWRSVALRPQAATRIAAVFVKTRDASKGQISVRIDLGGGEKFKGEVRGTIEPVNFEGRAQRFGVAVTEGAPLHLELTLSEPKPWWPNGLGDPNLYRLRVALVDASDNTLSTDETTFGLRSIEMAPSPGGPNPGRFNWTFVINGRPTFVKGTGWCTMDPLMDFSRERYDRFVSLARLQNVQMLRCWGSGMPETDDFYDLCDRAGIMVMQEWPTAWNSHNWQPFDQLEETVRLNTIRLRNHPSLVMYGGGDESGEPFGPAIDMMGRHAIELDDTRPFHRGEPWGGSRHDYTCWWGRSPLDFNLTMASNFFGEFGLASSPVLESVHRYLPANEREAWPPKPSSVFAYHTPVFNKMQDLERLLQYAGYFTENATMEQVVIGSQLAQATGVRHTLERARTRWPHCTGALYYKMNDNYPAASWSCADWYGAPKIGHYFFQDAFAPIHACLLLETLDVHGKPISLPVFLLDDAESVPGGWTVLVRAFDERLVLIKSQKYAGDSAPGRVRQVGAFALSEKETGSTPLLIVVEVRSGERLLNRTFYWLNHEARKGSLFALPQTKLSLAARDGRAVVTNTGSLPAVGVAVLRPGHLDTFTADDNYFWLDPGESHAVGVSALQGLTVEAWNAPA